MNPLRSPIYIGIALILISFASIQASAQHFPNVKNINPPLEFENVHVEKLVTDSLSTAFVIWVKAEVKPHIHQRHTESLYILEGSGKLMLDDEMVEINPGDFVLIPVGTVHSLIVTSKIPVKVISLQAPEFHGEDRRFIEPLRRPAQK